MKQPAMQFYIGDWKKERSVQCLALDTRMLWFELLMLMWDSEPRGYLVNPNGTPMTDFQIASIVNGAKNEANVRRMLNEMEEAGTYSKTDDGVIYNRRMARGGNFSKARSEAGKKGALVRWQNGKPIANAIENGMANGRQKIAPAAAAAAFAATAVVAAAAADWPLAAAAVREKFPTTDEKMLLTIVDLARKAYPELQDHELQAAVKEAYKPDQRSAALYRNTVPEVIQSWLVD